MAAITNLQEVTRHSWMWDLKFYFLKCCFSFQLLKSTFSEVRCFHLGDGPRVIEEVIVGDPNEYGEEKSSHFKSS